MFKELMAGTGCVLAGIALPAAEAMAQRSPSPMEDTCAEVVRGDRPGPAQKTTDPPDGAVVAPGQGVDVDITWPPDIFAGRLHKALDCVTVGGTLAPALSVEARDVDNDGLFEHRFAIPADVSPGTEVCDRGFVSGMGMDGLFSRNKTNEVCVTVGGPPETGPLRTPDILEQELEEEEGPAPPPRAFMGVVEVPPEPLPAPAPAVAPAPPVRPAPVGLPYTGAGDTALPMAGAALAFGGLAVMFGQSSRPRRAPVRLLHRGSADDVPFQTAAPAGGGGGHPGRPRRLVWGRLRRR